MDEENATVEAAGADTSATIEPYQELFISPRKYNISIMCVRFSVFACQVAAMVEQPNWPFMVKPGRHPDSFPSTEPLGFSSAMYLILMTSMGGVAVSGVCVGKLSDMKGRKPCILFCLFGTALGCFLKYVFRHSYWAYIGMNFIMGVLNPVLPVAMAYAGDVNETKRDKETQIGMLMGLNLIGMSSGGIISILMVSRGLFAPLLVAGGICVLGGILSTFFLIEPKRILAAREREREGQELGVMEGEDEGAPTTLDYKVFVNIIVGALLDNIGSSGMIPMSLAPLGLNAFQTNFMAEGKEPLMSENAYRWINVTIALMVPFGIGISPLFYSKIGLAGGVVFGNIITGIVIIALLYTALAEPATSATFGIFLFLLYFFFPFTVLSQMTTGPMLDAISPPDKRGSIQGTNVTVMNLGLAATPFVLGLVADAAGTPAAIWICVGLSFFAAVVNAPLFKVKRFRAQPKIQPAERKPLQGEDNELVERVLRGEWIAAEQLDAINEGRIKNKQPHLVPRLRTYEEEKDELSLLREHAKEDFLGRQSSINRRLHLVNTVGDLKSHCDKVNASFKAINQDEVDAANQEMGKWFTDYLLANGYTPHADALIIKHAIMSAFPTFGTNLSEGGITPENVEMFLLRSQKFYTRLIEQEGFDETPSLTVDKLLSGHSKF